MAFTDFNVDEIFREAQSPRGVPVSVFAHLEYDDSYAVIAHPKNRACRTWDTSREQLGQQWIGRFVRQRAIVRRALWREQRTAWRPKARLSRKLTDDQARVIRERYRDGGVSQAALSTQYGVSLQSLQSLLTGYTYKSAGGPVYWPNVGYRELVCQD